jgi:hypothetical protein
VVERGPESGGRGSGRKKGMRDCGIEGLRRGSEVSDDKSSYVKGCYLRVTSKRTKRMGAMMQQRVYRTQCLQAHAWLAGCAR